MDAEAAPREPVDLGPPREQIPLRTLLAFAGPAIPVSALGVAVAVYLPPYLAGHLGLSLVVVAATWTTVRLLDLFVDPVLGQLMDRTRTPLGRYRPWMLAGAPILMTAAGALFFAQPGMTTTFLIVALLGFYLGASILSLAQNALGATLATHYDERSRLFGVNTMVGIVGAVAVLIAPSLASLWGKSDAWAVQSMGWFVIFTTPALVLAAVAFTPERVRLDLHAAETAPIRDYIAVLMKPDLLRLAFAQICLTLGPGWMSNLYLFYFGDVLGFSVSQASILLVIYIVVGLLGAPATARLATRLGKHRALLVSAAGYSLGLCTVLVLPHNGSFWLAVPTMAWCGATAAGFNMMILAMMADVGDEIRLEQGKERTSLIFAINGVAAKIASAASLAIAFPLLKQIGFNPAEGATNTASALANLQVIYIFGPIFFVMLGGACVLGWRLDAARHADIRRELAARDAAAVR